MDRERALRELEELAVAANGQKEARWGNFRRYSRIRTFFWVLAALLAGTAAVLALGNASRTLIGVAAAAAAISTALESRIGPVDRRQWHQQAAAEYDKIAWWARHRAKGELSTAELDRELERLHEEKHSLDPEFGPGATSSQGAREWLPRSASRAP